MANAIVATAIVGISVAIVLSLGYVLVPMVVSNLPTPQSYGINASTHDCTAAGVTLDTYGGCKLDDAAAQTGIGDAKTIVFAGFALMAVSVIVLAAFFIISIFRS